MSIKHLTPTIALILVVFALTAPTLAENWPQWRGPRFDGTSAETGLPTTWSRTENLRWRLELPGPAASTPIVWNDRIFLTSTHEDTDELLLMAASRAGEVLWQRVLDQGKLEVFPQFSHETSHATPSPMTDGTHVWALFGTGKLACLSLDGELVWQTDLAARYGRPNMFFGLSMSPLLYEGRIYLQLLHADAQLVVALDKSTGEEIWKTERPTNATGECLHSYASPVPMDDKVIIHGADFITAHRVEDGAEIWRYGSYNPPDNYNSMFRMVATPVVGDGAVVVPTAKRGPVFLLRPDSASGDLTSESGHVAWSLATGTPDVPSPLIHDGRVYLNGERGTLTVLDLAEGTKLHDQRVHQSTHRGSPVVADGRLFLVGTDGTVSVVAADGDFDVLAQNQLGEYLAASPAVSDGTLYLRTYEALYAIGLEPDEAAASAETR